MRDLSRQFSSDIRTQHCLAGIFLNLSDGDRLTRRDGILRDSTDQLCCNMTVAAEILLIKCRAIALRCFGTAAQLQTHKLAAANSPEAIAAITRSTI